MEQQLFYDEEMAPHTTVSNMDKILTYNILWEGHYFNMKKRNSFTRKAKSFDVYLLILKGSLPR